MEIILLQPYKKLGNIGDICEVANGFAKNYIIPRKIGIRATAKNKKEIAEKKQELELQNAKRKEEALKSLDKINNLKLVFIKNASNDGKMFGSLTSKEIASQCAEKTGVQIEKPYIFLEETVKTLGISRAKVRLYQDVYANIYLNVARSEEEAKSSWEAFRKQEDEELKKKEEESKVKETQELKRQ